MLGIVTDITERKRADEALRKSESFAKKVVESSLNGIYIYNFGKNKSVYVNPQYTKLTGWTLEDLNAMTGIEFFSLFHPDDQARVSAHMEEMRNLPDGHAVEMECRFKTAFGGWIWYHSREVVYERDPAGKVRQYIGTFLDITERKHTEATIWESEEHLRAAFEQAGVGMALRAIDPRNSRWLRVNQKLCDILGYTKDELLQLTSIDTTPPEERHIAIDYNEKLCTGEIAGYSREKRYLRKNGSCVWTNISLAAARGRDGRPTHVICVIQDIDERKRIETERAKLATIVENANDAIIGRALDGTISSWNPAAERLFGYTAAEAIGCKLEQIIPPELTRERAEIRKRISRAELVPNFETVRVAKNGRRFDVSVSISPIEDGSGNIVGMVAIARDITERKQAERELQHQTELARLLEQLARAANEAVSPEAAMETCLARICEHGNWALGRVARFAPRLSRYSPEHSQWFCTEPAHFDAFMRFSEGFEYDPATDTFLSLVLRDQRPIWQPNLTMLSKPKSSRLAKAVEAGLKAAFAFPVIVRGDVVAVLEFFATETRQLDALLIEGATALASQFARMIERSAANDTRARLAAIVENSSDAIIGRSLDLTITSWNASAERIFGYTAAEAIGHKLIEFHPSELRQNVAKRRKLILAGRPVRNAETVRVAKDGRRIDVTLISVSPIRDSDGNITGTASILRDITRHRQNENALRESERHYRNLFDNMFEGFAYCRMIFENGQPRDWVYVEINPAFEKLTGLKNVVGRKVTEVIPGLRESNPELLERYGRVASTGTSEMFETYVVPVEKWFSISAFCPEKGYFVVVFENITERKAAEQKVRDYADDLGTLSHKLLEVQEDESKRLVRETHDQIGQVLTALNAVMRGDLYMQHAGAINNPMDVLTRRQREILQLVAEGQSVKSIALRLNRSIKTVETHRGKIMKRLSIHDIPGLVRFAIRVGLVSADK